MPFQVPLNVCTSVCLAALPRPLMPVTSLWETPAGAGGGEEEEKEEEEEEEEEKEEEWWGKQRRCGHKPESRLRLKSSCTTCDET